MIPLLHIFTSFSALFCLVAFAKLSSSYRKTKSVNIGDFAKGYLSLGVYFILVSLPVVLSDPVKAQIAYILSYIFLILSPAFLFRAALRILDLKFWLDHIFQVAYGSIILVTILNIIFFSPSIIRTSGSEFYHWGEGTPLWLASFNGILAGSLVAGCAFFFFWGGKRSKEKAVRARAFLISGGLVILLVAALLNYILAPASQGLIKWGISAFATFLAIPGLAVLLIGIYHKEKETDIG